MLAADPADLFPAILAEPDVDLHRLVYAVAPLGLLHFFWMRAAKNNLAEVAVYAAIVTLLLGWRVARWWRARRPQAQAAPGLSR